MKLFGSAQGKDPRAQQWSLEDFREYFRNERGNIGNSKKFQQVIRAFDEFAALRGQLVNQETAIKMVKANENLKKACEEYVQSRQGARSGSGKERLAVVDCLSMFREDLNLDQARDMKVVRGLEGKTWEQAGQFQVAQVVLEDGGRQAVGDAMSQRFKVEHGGKKGFFTERMEMESLDAQMDKMIGSIDRDKNPALAEALGSIKDKLTFQMKGFMKSATILDEEYEVVEFISGLNEENPAKKNLKELMLHSDKLSVMTNAVKQYQSMLKESGPDVDPEKKGELMDKAIKDAISEYGYKDSAPVMQACKETLMEVPPIQEVNNRSTKMYRMIKKNFLLAKEEALPAESQAEREQREAIDRALEDRNFMETWQKGIDIAHASEVGAGRGMIGLDVGNELSSRNIASSRIAELLGIGGIIAHSEKMVVRSGDKVTTGCFMEFAEGMDITAKGERSKRILDQVDLDKQSASFNKDVAIMEVFDYLCAQNDRHDRNMFYKLGEPDAQGKRAIIGLQGIDGDLAFGDKDDILSEVQGQLEDMTFIPSELADKVAALDEDTLRYAIGDLIPEHQIQVMMKRVEKFKDHMNKNMVRIDNRGWDLNEYSKDQPVDQLDARGKAYVAGLKSIEKAISARYPWEVTHKNAVVKSGFDGYRKKRQAEPQVAINFDEVKKQERNTARPRPSVPLGKKSDEAVARARQLREEYRKKMEAMKTKQTPQKTAAAPEKKSQEAGRKR